VDGGKTIQGFLEADLIDEMIITTIPIVLGSGIHCSHQVPRRGSSV
jgi:dihydrofolate reductase